MLHENKVWKHVLNFNLCLHYNDRLNSNALLNFEMATVTSLSHVNYIKIMTCHACIPEVDHSFFLTRIFKDAQLVKCFGKKHLHLSLFTADNLYHSI